MFRVFVQQTPHGPTARHDIGRGEHNPRLPVREVNHHTLIDIGHVAGRDREVQVTVAPYDKGKPIIFPALVIEKSTIRFPSNLGVTDR